MEKVIANIELVQQWLENSGVKVVGTTNEFFGGDPDADGQGLWIAADEDINGQYFNYFVNPKNTNYEFGIHVGFATEARRLGYWFEWYDAATLMIWPF